VIFIPFYKFFLIVFFAILKKNINIIVLLLKNLMLKEK